MHKTGKSVKKNLTPKTGKTYSSWREAIEYSKRLLEQNKQRAAKLRAAIRVFEEKLAAGDPWPGSEHGHTGTS